MFDEENLGELMREETFAPAPKSTVDVMRAVTDGRRRRRRRAAAGGLVAAATVLTMVAGGIGVNAAFGRGEPPVGHASPAHSATAKPAGAPTAFNPAVRAFAIGWHPSETTNYYQDLQAGSQALGYDLPSEDVQRDVVIIAYPRTATPDIGLVMPGKPGSHPLSAAETRARLLGGAAGPSVAGRPTHWLTGAGETAQALAWEWSPDAWILLSVNGYGAKGRGVAGRVARSVRTNLSVAVPVPFVLPRPPAPLRLAETLYATHSGRVSEVALSFSDRSDLMDPVTRMPRMLNVEVTDYAGETGDGGKVPNPNTTLAGRPAYTDIDAKGGVVDRYGVNGWLVALDVYDPVTARYVPPATAVSLASNITVTAPPDSDPTDWGTRPIR